MQASPKPMAEELKRTRVKAMEFALSVSF